LKGARFGRRAALDRILHGATSGCSTTTAQVARTMVVEPAMIAAEELPRLLAIFERCGIYLNHHVAYRFLDDSLATKRALTAWAERVNRSRRSSRAEETFIARTRRWPPE
jgi:hypothetical protein